MALLRSRSRRPAVPSPSTSRHPESRRETPSPNVDRLTGSCVDVTVKRLALVSFLLATGSSANASPPWLLSELFVRADTIALVTVIAPDAHSVVLRSKTLYRGARLPA